MRPYITVLLCIVRLKYRAFSLLTSQWHCFSQQDCRLSLVIFPTLEICGLVGTPSLCSWLPIRICIVLLQDHDSSWHMLILLSVIWILCHYNVLVLLISLPVSISKLVDSSVNLLPWWELNSLKSQVKRKCCGHPVVCCDTVTKCKWS